MSTAKPRSLLRLEYARAAEAYSASLPLEHFMESTSQATQREITMESLALVKPHRPDLYYFNELLIQYPVGKPPEIHRVVPDNLVVLSEQPVQAEGSFDLPLQPVGPFWALEYISPNNPRKDYEDSFQKYERDLKVPYLLLFYPDGQELTLYRHRVRKYTTVRPNRAGRYAIRELELEVALQDGWMRYWFRGQLLPLPADLQRQLEEARRQLEQLQGQLDHERHQKERLLAQLRELGIEPKL